MSLLFRDTELWTPQPEWERRTLAEGKALLLRNDSFHSQLITFENARTATTYPPFDFYHDIAQVRQFPPLPSALRAPIPSPFLCWPSSLDSPDHAYRDFGNIQSHLTLDFSDIEPHLRDTTVPLASVNPNATSPASADDSSSDSQQSSPSPTLDSLTLLPQPSSFCPAPGTHEALILSQVSHSPTLHTVACTLLNSPEYRTGSDLDRNLLLSLCRANEYVAGTGNGKHGIRGGIQDYDCLLEGCGKKIKRRDHMLNHLRKHFGIKPFPCPFVQKAESGREACSTRFLRYDDLKRHVRSVHQRDLDNNGCVRASLSPLI